MVCGVPGRDEEYGKQGPAGPPGLVGPPLVLAGGGGGGGGGGRHLHQVPTTAYWRWSQRNTAPISHTKEMKITNVQSSLRGGV